MTLHHDISQYYFLKSTIEDLFGRDAWYEMKECRSIAKWRKTCIKLLKALEVAIDATVKVADDAWRKEVSDEIELSIERLRNPQSIDELFSISTAALIRISLLQVGFIPRRKGHSKITLTKRHWQLDRTRSVQYIQTPEQVKRSGT